jgi:hypothetical protein
MKTIKELIQILQKNYDPKEKYIGSIITHEEILEKYDDVERPIVLSVLLTYQDSIETVEDLENILQDDSQFQTTYDEE